MWWIAACLGALVWLLAVRIRVKEKERQAMRLERAAARDKTGRAEFLEGVFLTAARQYLSQTPQFSALLLAFAHVEWEDKPSEVHMEVIPVSEPNGAWPAWLESCPWVAITPQGLTFSPPEAHWERLKDLESGLSKVACFADVAPPVPAVKLTLGDYRLYAVARRASEDVELDVVGEPN